MTISRTDLLTIDVPVEAPEGIVYSTNPFTAQGIDQASYFTKGPDLEIVFAELAGCELAREVGLPVANVKACTSPDGILAGSIEVQDAIRYIGPWLDRTQKIANFDDLFDSIVVDVWLANKDRNIGNVIGRPRPNSSTIDLLFIDYEKSLTLRPNPTVLSTMLEPRLLWPSGELGMVLRDSRPLHPPVRMLQRIASITEQKCSEIVTDVVNVMESEIAWHENSVHALMHRAKRIKELAEEVWTTA